MKQFGYGLMIVSAVALVRGLWLITPVAGWIGLALVAYVVGYFLSDHDDGPGMGATGRPKRRPLVVVHHRGEA